MTNKAEEKPKSKGPYDKLLEEIEAAEVKTKQLALDVTTPEGNEAARSHQHYLRSLNGKADAWKKKGKASILERGRKIDAGHKELKEKVAAIIEIYDAPLKAEKEKQERIAAAMAEQMEGLRTMVLAEDCLTSEQLRSVLTNLKGMNVVEEAWGDYLDEAESVIAEGIESLQERIVAAEAAEEEARANEEMREKLRKFEEKEAADKAEALRLAEEKEAQAVADAKAEEKRLADERAEEERIAREKREAEERAEFEENARLQAEQEARDKIEAEKAIEAAAEKRRQANIQHVEKIDAEIVSDLIEIGLGEAGAERVLRALKEGKITNTSLVY